MWKGDRVAACISAASVIAKVTRDRIMCELHGEFPAYDFDCTSSSPRARGALVGTVRVRSNRMGSSTCGVPLAYRPAPISLEPQLELWDPTDPAEDTDHEPQEVLR